MPKVKKTKKAEYFQPSDKTFQRIKHVLKRDNHPLKRYFDTEGLADRLCRCDCDPEIVPEEGDSVYQTCLKNLCPRFAADYAILGRLGAGTHGAVYAARSINPGRDSPEYVAVKMAWSLPPTHRSTKIMTLNTLPGIEPTKPFERIGQEPFKLWFLRGTPRIARVYASYLHGLFIYTVMDLYSVPINNEIRQMPETIKSPPPVVNYPGENLVYEEGPSGLNEAEVRKVMTHLVEAITFANERAFIHTDMSHRNYLISEALSAQLIDFDDAHVNRAQTNPDGGGEVGEDNMLFTNYCNENYIDPELGLLLEQHHLGRIAEEGLEWRDVTNEPGNTALPLERSHLVDQNWRTAVLMFDLLHGYAPWEDPAGRGDFWVQEYAINMTKEGFEHRTDRRKRMLRDPVAISDIFSQDAVDALQCQLGREEFERPSMRELHSFPWFQGTNVGDGGPFVRPDLQPDEEG
ncbi:MAG: hypothetical protein M1833_000473 [Piccolia ochrophora]|nr:MAG: hypothetical protein M1833_000473 [Piccolia ochrophora]